MCNAILTRNLVHLTRNIPQCEHAMKKEKKEGIVTSTLFCHNKLMLQDGATHGAPYIKDSKNVQE